MLIQRGDFVRPNTPGVGLPRGSVWRVICADGPLKLEPENGLARSVPRRVTEGCRYPVRDFEKVLPCRGQWVSVRYTELHSGPALLVGDWTPHQPEARPNSLFSGPDAVDIATIAAERAASATAATASMLEAARKLEAERQEELRIAKVAKAKADKEAAARAKVAKAKADKAAAAKAKAEEAKRQLAARLHADRCLGEATLELIAEVSRLNNGGSEQVAAASIAQHIDQLQALAKSYGYRIVKPSMLAQVVKL